ncbi:MerR family transcriptional regulator [Allonocardiopsis opalescens]|uniref:DNA-binding transcriptional MerR regulator n=1 Tax=Allonocardiopsis opalescens TaxID=1144618 RepID=A0A2T0QAB9_9ACTN|nr:MerR family transcriptional regulator [Allonocardiopsis opalescens]PRY00761.1 DNA-binding transcriptional MerR regulator [Allonocardiopsis opalescens]
MGDYRISDLAARSGFPASTLRFYEQAGLLPARRTAAGHRRYGDTDLDRLALIRTARSYGLPLPEIGRLLAVWEGGACGPVRAALRPLLAERAERTAERAAGLAAGAAALAEADAALAAPPPSGPCRDGCGCVDHRAAPARFPDAAPVERGAAPAACGRDCACRADAAAAPAAACSLPPDAMAARVAAWRALAARAVRREARPDGVRLIFPTEPELAAELARLAAAELDCCGFFAFTLELDAEGLRMAVRAPEAGLGMLAELFGAGPSVR